MITKPFENRLAETAKLTPERLRFYTTLLLTELQLGTRLESKDIERLRKKVNSVVEGNKKLKFSLKWTQKKERKKSE